MTITVSGFSAANKRPGFFAATVFGAGPISLLTIPLVLLLVGQKSTAGTMAADLDVVTFNSDADADTLAGAGSELAQMEYTARAEGSGFVIKGFAPAVAGGAAAATATVTFVGVASSAGQWTYWIDGVPYVLVVPNGQAIATSATALATLINNDPRASVIATPAAGVVTLADKVLTIRGNRKIIYQDKTSAPGTQTSAVAGGTSVTSSTNVTGVYFTSGAGVETLTNTLNVLFPGLYDRIALATNDATSLALWVTQSNSKAGATEGRLEHYVFGSSDTLANATTIAQTTVNNQRFQCVWLQNSETTPPRLAAAMAAVRTQAEGPQPNSGYDGFKFQTVVGQRFNSDWVSNTTQESALNNSITPFLSSSDGKASCVRSITTRSLNGAVPDYRTIDTSMAVVPDFVRTDLAVLWSSDFKVNNKWVKPDPPAGAKDVASGVATPSGWNSYVLTELHKLEDANILTNTTIAAGLPNSGAPQSEWNSAQQCIMTSLPVYPLPLNHQQGLNVLQMNVSQ